VASPRPKYDRTLYEKPPDQTADFEPDHEALSYVWGDAADTVAVRVIGYSQTTLDIRCSLIRALKHLRYPDRLRTLWVDAICINQRDKDERNVEVKRMVDIYSLAARVVIWLGEEADDSAHALTALEHLGKQFELVTMASSDGACLALATGANSQSRWSSSTMAISHKERTWSSFAAVFRRPWFTRLWVLQEALLANSKSIVQCGHKSMLWALMRRAILALVKRNRDGHEVTSLVRSYSIAMEPHQSRGLQELLAWGGSRQTTDPRDRIYGLVSLLSESLRNRIRIDYSKPLWQVYMDCLLAHVSITRNVALLEQCRLKRQIVNGPSWVPDWSSVPSWKENYLFGAGSAVTRRPAGYSASQVRFVAPSLLEVTGLRCATIASVTDVADAAMDTSTFVTILRQWEPADLHGSGYITGKPLLDAFLETIFLGGTRDRYPEFRDSSTLRELKDADLAARSIFDTGYKAFKRLKDTLDHRAMAFLTTSEGYIGVAAPGAEPGLC
jgi:hypothetical protein